MLKYIKILNKVKQIIIFYHFSYFKCSNEVDGCNLEFNLISFVYYWTNEVFQHAVNYFIRNNVFLRL